MARVLGDPVRGVLGYPITPYAWTIRFGVPFHVGALSVCCNPWGVDLTPSPLGRVGGYQVAGPLLNG